MKEKKFLTVKRILNRILVFCLAMIIYYCLVPKYAYVVDKEGVVLMANTITGDIVKIQTIDIPYQRLRRPLF